MTIRKRERKKRKQRRNEFRVRVSSSPVRFPSLLNFERGDIRFACRCLGGLRGVETQRVSEGVRGRKRRAKRRGAGEGGGWRADVTVTASSAAWANRCAHTRVRSIDPPLVAAVCASRVMTSEMTSSLAPFASRPRCLPFFAPLRTAVAATVAAAATHGTVLI